MTTQNIEKYKMTLEFNDSFISFGSRDSNIKNSFEMLDCFAESCRVMASTIESTKPLLNSLFPGNPKDLNVDILKPFYSHINEPTVASESTNPVQSADTLNEEGKNEDEENDCPSE